MKLQKTVLRDPAVGSLEGGFVRMPTLSMQANLMIRVSDPATGASVETLPAHQFNWPTQDMGLPSSPDRTGMDRP